MLTKMQRTILNEMRRLFKITQCPDAKAKIELLNTIEDAFNIADDMDICDVKEVTEQVLKSYKTDNTRH